MAFQGGGVRRSLTLGQARRGYPTTFSFLTKALQESWDGGLPKLGLPSQHPAIGFREFRV